MEHIAKNSTPQDTEKVISSGDRLTIETIAEYAQLLSQSLAEAETVVIEFKTEVELDITALQVFCSACRMATAQGKKFMHRGPTPKALIDLSATAGAERHTPCSYNNEFCFRQFGGLEKWEN